MTQPTYDLLNFRFYDDDGTGEDDQTALGTGNNQTLDRGTGTTNRFCARIELYNDNAKGGVETWDWEYSYDSGAWTAISTSSSVIRAYDSSLLTDGEDCTQRLTSSTPFFVANTGVDETGQIPAVTVGAGIYLENLLSCYIVDADVADGKTIDIRVTESSGDTITYTNTPNLTVDKVATTLVYKDTQLKWDMRELVNDDLQIKYDMFELISDDIQIKWDIFALIGQETQAKWDIFGLVGQEVQAKWNMRELVGQNIEAVWDILSNAIQVFKDMQAKWDINNLVNQTIQAKYDIFELVGNEIQAKWDMLNLAGNELQAKWDISILVTKSIEAKWDILNLVNNSIQAVYDVRQLAGRSLQTRWDILGDVPPDEDGGKRSLRQTAYRWTSRIGR